MERITNIAARLKEYRDLYDLTLADMEKKTGVPAQTINRYELGQRAPKIDVAVNLAESLSINPLWLQGYNVPIDKPIIAKDDGLSQEIIDLLTSLSESDLDIVLSVARQMQQREQQQSK